LHFNRVEHSVDKSFMVSSSDEETKVLIWDSRRRSDHVDACSEEETSTDAAASRRECVVGVIDTANLKGLPRSGGMVTSLGYSSGLSLIASSGSNSSEATSFPWGCLSVGFEGGLVGFVDTRRLDR
jgi:hypothetical protein